MCGGRSPLRTRGMPTGKFVADNEQWIFEFGWNFGMGGEEWGCRDVDFACGRFVNLRIWSAHFVFWKIGQWVRRQCFEADGAIYCGVWIKKAPIEFPDAENIFGGARTFPGLTSSYDNYEGEMQYIPTLPSRAKQMDEPLKKEERFALRSELGGLVRIDRIARPGA